MGDKISVRRSEKQKFMPEADWLKAEEEKKKKEKEKKDQKDQKRRKEEKTLKSEGDFKVFNEKGEKTWKSVEDDTTTISSSVAPSLADEKVVKEFC